MCGATAAGAARDDEDAGNAEVRLCLVEHPASDAAVRPVPFVRRRNRSPRLLRSPRGLPPPPRPRPLAALAPSAPWPATYPTYADPTKPDPTKPDPTSHRLRSPPSASWQSRAPRGAAGHAGLATAGRLAAQRTQQRACFSGMRGGTSQRARAARADCLRWSTGAQETDGL